MDSPPADVPRRKTADEVIEEMSKSKLGLLGRCPAAVEFRYVDQRPQRITPAMAWGRSLDQTQNLGFEQKLTTGEPPKVTDAADWFASSFVKEAEEVHEWDGEQLGPMKDQGVDHAKLWANTSAVAIQPVTVQERFTLDVGDWKLTGVTDLVGQRTDTEDPRWSGVIVLDNKTTKRSWNAQTAREQLDAPIYSLAAECGAVGQGKADPWRVGFDIAVRLKKPKRQRFLVSVTREERDAVLTQMDTARRAIGAMARAGSFPPNRQSWMCSKKQCSYWRECLSRHGGYIRD